MKKSFGFLFAFSVYKVVDDWLINRLSSDKVPTKFQEITDKA
jgi:hypothetical protein